MDIETKAMIISILDTLREVTVTAFEAREMAFRNFVSLRVRPGYAEAYQSQKGDLLEQMQASREKILTRLRAHSTGGRTVKEISDRGELNRIGISTVR